MIGKYIASACTNARFQSSESRTLRICPFANRSENQVTASTEYFFSSAARAILHVSSTLFNSSAVNFPRVASCSRSSLMNIARSPSTVFANSLGSMLALSGTSEMSFFRSSSKSNVAFGRLSKSMSSWSRARASRASSRRAISSLWRFSSSAVPGSVRLAARAWLQMYPSGLRWSSHMRWRAIRLRSVGS